MPKKKKLNKKEKQEVFESTIPILKKMFKKKPSIMGFDLSTSATGFFHLFVVNSASSYGQLVKSEKKGNHINVRIVDIVDTLSNFVKTNSNSIAVIEDYSFGLRGSSVAQLAELGGCVKSLLLKEGIGFFKVAPQTLKKFVLGPSRGKASGKEFMLLEVMDRWNRKFSSSDVCDAFCLAKFIETLGQYVNDPDSLRKWEQDMFFDFVVNRGIPIGR
jgi:Holliday junction resolvasome RuvABC endonuclease subunit